MATECIVVLGGGYTAPKSFYDRIKHEILDACHVLQPGVAYTAENLCGPDLWGALKKGEPSLAGRCVRDMVSKGVLPLEVEGCEHQYPRRYTIKSTNF